MRAVLAAVVLLIVTAPAASGATVTIPDDVGDIIVGPEISDIVEAHVTYSAKRLTVSVTHRDWRWEWGHKRAATGGLVTFGNGRSFVIVPNNTGRRSQLYTRKGLRNCPDGQSCKLPVTAGATRSMRTRGRPRSVCPCGVSEPGPPESRCGRSTSSPSPASNPSSTRCPPAP
ncbi:MAG: hypothetical protein IPG68_02740 [Micrococcales bacterium]|nr:hypothetical protein [Micrococcales bacterium]